MANQLSYLLTLKILAMGILFLLMFITNLKTKLRLNLKELSLSHLPLKKILMIKKIQMQQHQLPTRLKLLKRHKKVLATIILMKV